MKTIACKDMDDPEMKNCPWKGEGETSEELVEQAKNHVKSEHKNYWKNEMSKMKDEDIKKVIESKMKEEGGEGDEM